MFSYNSFNDAVKLVTSTNVTPFFNTSGLELRQKQFEDGYIATFSGSFSSIKLTANISSLAVSPFPEIFPEDSDMERMAKVLLHEQKYPRYGLEFFIRHHNRDWLMVGRKILFNHNTIKQTDCLQPMYSRDGLFEFSIGTQLGYRFKDLGHGLPTSADDFTLLYAGKEQYYLQFKPTRSVKSSVSFKCDLIANNSTLVRPESINRKAVTITNTSSEFPAWLSFGVPGAIGEGMFVAPYGSYSWEVSSYTLDLPIYAISSNNLSLSGSEFYI